MFEMKKATRQGIKPLICLFGESGSGKTYSALLLARGFVGDSGKIAMIDTESGRGSLYADVIPGGYETLEIREPFSPSRYIEAIQVVEQSGAAVLVIDSGSHSWEGIGGVTDMATEISKGRAEKYNKEWDGVVQFGDWKLPKMEHNRLLLKLLQSPLPIIVCLRAKKKSSQVKGTEDMAQAGIIQRNQVGKTVVIKDDFASPIQHEDFVYEFMAYMSVNNDHSVSVLKHSHPSLRDCFPKDKTTPITIEHGQKLAEWCSAAGKPVTQTQKKPVVATETTRNWMLEQLSDIHMKMQAYAIDLGIIMPDEGLDSWPLEKTPTSKAALAELRAKIEAHQ